MAPKCEVASLSSLALYNIVTQVTHALSDDEGLYYHEVGEYHKYTPPEIIEDMLNEILTNINLDAGIRFSCLQVFLRNNIRKLVTGIFPHSYYDRIMETIAHNGNGLFHLNLNGVWMKDNPELLISVLQQMNKLKVLHIPHMANDEVLENLANCKNLKILDISGECYFTDEGLSQFCKSLVSNKSQIKILDIGSFGEENIPHELIADLIESLPNLASLCSYSFVGKSLLHLYKRNQTFQSQLTYIHDTLTTREICEAIIHLCPVLESLYFDSPDQGGVVELINKFDKLTGLKLNNFHCDELHTLLSNWENNTLRTIKLSLGRGEMDATILSKCPQLTSLDLYKMDLITHSANTLLEKLEEFEIVYCEITSECMRYILECSPELRNVEVYETVKLTDGDLYRLCANCCLLNLEQLWIASARYLTLNTVELLMGHCPRLRMLGQLTEWNISPGDVDFMRAIIQSTNTDLTLLPVGIFADPEHLYPLMNE